DFGENPLLFEGLAEQRAAAHLVANALDVGPEFGIGQPFGQQVQGLQDGQSGANQGHKLLVEDEELLQVGFLLPAEETASAAARASLDGVDQEALLRVLLAQFLLARGRSHLVVDLPAPVCVLQHKIGHGYCPASTSCAPLGTWNWNNLASRVGSTFSASKWNSRIEWSKPVTLTTWMRRSASTTNSTAEYGRLSVFGSAVILMPAPSAFAFRLRNSFWKSSLPRRKASGARMSSLSLSFILSARFSSGVYSQRYFPSLTKSLPLG